MQNSSKYLIIITLLLALASYVLLLNKSPEAAVDALLIPELQDKVNDVDGISISQGQSVLHFYKDGGVWRIKELNSFFADTNKIAQMLLNLRNFKLKQPKTSNPKNYQKLGLADSQAINIVLKSNENTFADLFIGKQALKTQGSYVRKKSDKQSWLSTGQLRIELDKNYWMVKNIIDVDASQIQSVSYQAVDDEFKIIKAKPADEVFLLEPMPKDKQLKSSVDLNSLANGLSKFTIDSVVSDITLDEDNLVNSLSYVLFSGVIYQLKLYKQADESYVKIAVENTATLTAVEKQLDKWIFTLPKFKFDALNKKITDILEEVSTKKLDSED